MRNVWLAIVCGLAGCGDNAAVHGRFELVGHADLGARGMNAALAVADTVVYVGARNDHHGISIVDVGDPTHPTVVGEINDPEGLAGMSSRELRAIPDLDLLVVLNLQCSPSLHGCDATRGEPENLRFYDIHDRRHPVVLSTYVVTGTTLAPRSPHEMYVRRDGPRVLVYLTTPPGPPALEVIDATDPRAPVRVVAWDPVHDGGVKRGGADDILHSLALSPDGTTAYLAHQQGGLVLADVSTVPPTLITPPANAVTWPAPTGTSVAIGPHSAVKVPTRDLLVVTEEIYPQPFGTGCPWGHLRLVDIADPTTPTIAGEFALPENDAASCAGVAPRVAFTAHNPTVMRDVALVTWYAGGLQAIDISDPANPLALAEYRPEPIPHVDAEDPALGGALVEMWSYPVVVDGLVYVVDVRNGLYILRYVGYREDEIRATKFSEGNSNR